MSNARESYAHLADGRPIYFFEEGTGPPFLYVHASTDIADGARGMFESLRDRFRCISLDRVGYHRSGTLGRVTTLEEQVEAIAAVHSACTSEPVWVFGHSAGGNWAVAYALAHPQKACGLVLMEPALYSIISPGRRSPGVIAMIESVGPLFRAGRLHEAVTEFMGIIQPELSPKALAERVADFLSPEKKPRWESMATEQPLVVSWCPTPSEWAQLTQPALVIEGDRTGEVLRAVAARVSELLPRGELATLEGLDHSAPWSAPDVVSQRAIEFIDRVATLKSKSN
jgi:pimeloyl-ACP methyl ester carboxylesterase